MDGEVGAAFFERGLELLDEQALAADLARACGRGSGRRASSCRSSVDRRWPRASQQRPHVLGLPQREAAFARGDDELAQVVRSMLAGVPHASMARCTIARMHTAAPRMPQRSRRRTAERRARPRRTGRWSTTSACSAGSSAT